MFDPGIFSIGDTVTVPGKKFKFSGIPTFAPEHFARVSARDSMKRKQFVKGTEQIAQEGAIQIFKVPGSGMEEVIVGVVGVLQFDVFQYRMKNEYGVELRMDHLPYEELRLIDSYPGDLQDLNLGSDAELLEDYRDRKLLDHYVEPVAIRYSLTLPEISLLVYLSQKPRVDTLKELADITGMSRARLVLKCL